MIRGLLFLPCPAGSLAAVIALAITAAPLAAQNLAGAETAAQEQGQRQVADLAPAEALGRFLAHSGKVMQLPSGERLVLYLPLESLFVLNDEDQIANAARVSVDDDRSIYLHWLGGGAEQIDLADLSGIQFLDEVPAVMATMSDQILGQPFGADLKPIPAGAQLAEGGVIFSEAGDVLGNWDLRAEHAVVFIEGHEPARIALSDLSKAVTSEAPEPTVFPETGGN